jgi:hypothetical protein
VTNNERDPKLPESAERNSERMEHGATRRTGDEQNEIPGEQGQGGHMGAVETEMIPKRPPTKELNKLINDVDDDEDDEISPNNELTPG